MMSEKPEQSPREQKRPDPDADAGGQNLESYFSPRFKSVAAMAGWDEESILVASLIVEDTPERGFKHNKRSISNFKIPPFSTSSRKRGSQTKSSIPGPVPFLGDDEEEPAKQESEKKKKEVQVIENEDNKAQRDDLTDDSGVLCSKPVIPCMDKLREELSCAICLEICFEPSTTSCGHSFCKKCLRSAADKCGKRCPKCRQLISNGRTCTVNTVLWNTIQLLFPQEVEARKAAGASNKKEAEHQSPEGRSSSGIRRRSVRRRESLSHEDSTLAQRIQREELSLLISRNSSGRRRREMPIQDEDSSLAQRLRTEELSQIISRNASGRRRRGTPSQDEDAALALRLQREEFMEAFRETNEHSRSSLSLARANLRAMASRAINIRMREQPT